jgi:protein Mpv17
MLHEKFPKQIFGSSAASVAAKIAVDQLTMEPFLISCFFITRGAFEGKNATDIQQKIKSDLPSTWLTAAMIWPAAQVATFTVVPLKWQLLYVNGVSLCWNTFMSFAATFKRDYV